MLAPVPMCAGTVTCFSELGRASDELLSRARLVGAVRPDIGPADLRRLLSGLHVAVDAGEDADGARDRYLAVLLAGLRAP